jgi:hypothetical protein
MPSKPSAIAEQLGHPSVQSGPNMKWYTTSRDRPEKRPASVAFPAFGREPVVLLDRDPRQRSTLASQLVAAPRELLLLLEQREPRCGPCWPCERFTALEPLSARNDRLDGFRLSGGSGRMAWRRHESRRDDGRAGV